MCDSINSIDRIDKINSIARIERCFFPGLTEKGALTSSTESFIFVKAISQPFLIVSPCYRFQSICLKFDIQAYFDIRLWAISFTFCGGLKLRFSTPFFRWLKINFKCLNLIFHTVWKFEFLGGFRNFCCSFTYESAWNS